MGTASVSLGRGTFGYAAPEALDTASGSNPQTSAVDMWSLGAVCFKLMAQDIPFPDMGVLFQYAAGRHPFPLERLGHVSAHGQRFIVALMSPKPVDRSSADDARLHQWITLARGSVIEGKTKV